MNKTKQEQLKKLTREELRSQVREAAIKLEEQKPTKQQELLRFPVASDTPVKQWFGKEVLSHAKGSLIIGERQKTLPLLFNHDRDKIIGIVEKLEHDDHRTYATVRFAKTEEGKKARSLVDDKILVNVSIRYEILDYDYERGTTSDEDIYTATSWEISEVSLVTIPADPTVGVYRSLSKPTERGIQMDKNETQDVAQTKPIDQSLIRAQAAKEAVEMQRAREAEISQLRESERQRVTSIYTLCRQFGIDDAERDEMIRSGSSVADINSRVLDLLKTRSASPAAMASRSLSEDMGLTRKEQQSFSLIRALNACMTGDWSNAGFEREVSRTIAQRCGRDSAGFFMPSDVSFLRAEGDTTPPPSYVVGTPAYGGNLVETELRASSFIDLLRNKAMVMKMGATIISGLQGNVEIPRQTGASTTYWVAENGEPTRSAATTDKVALKPKTIGALSNISRNMLLQPSLNMENFVRSELAKSLALGIDLAALCGTGTDNQPLGIANMSGICTVVGGTNGANLTFDHLIDMETQVASANADVSNMYYLCNAVTIGYLKKIKDTSGDYIWRSIVDAVKNGFPGEVNGYGVARSNQVRANLTKGTATKCSEIYFGNWSDLLIGEWGYLEVDVNRYGDAWKSGGVDVKAMQSVDIAVRHPKSFCVFSDALVG